MHDLLVSMRIFNELSIVLYWLYPVWLLSLQVLSDSEFDFLKVVTGLVGFGSQLEHKSHRITSGSTILFLRFLNGWKYEAFGTLHHKKNIGNTIFRINIWNSLYCTQNEYESEWDLNCLYIKSLHRLPSWTFYFKLFLA